MTAAHSALNASERLNARAEKLAAAAERAKARAKAFEKGAEGELEVANELARLTSAGYYLLHDRSIHGLGGNVDHIVVGPTGVYVINAKNWANVSLRKGGLYSFNRSRGEALERLEKERLSVGIFIHESAAPVPVKGLLVFTQGFQTDGSFPYAATLKDLCARIQNGPQVLTSHQVERVVSTLLSNSAPAGSVMEAPTRDEFNNQAARAAKLTFKELDEKYSRLYFRRWSRGGAQRLYVSDCEGTETGWKDLLSGKIVISENSPPSRATKHLLKQVSSAQDLSSAKAYEAAAGGSFARKLANSFKSTYRQSLVGWYWQGHGQRRLYVHLLTSEREGVELGFVDLSTGEIHITCELAGRGESSSHLLSFMWMGAN